MKKILTIMFTLGVIFFAMIYTNAFANSPTFTTLKNYANKSSFANAIQIQNKDDTFLKNFEEVTIINSAATYLITENGETLRLSGINTLTQAGDNFIYNSLLNRKVWIYRDGVDIDNCQCVYVFTSQPSETLKLDTSLNRLIIAKCYGTNGNVSNGPLSNALKNFLIYPIP